MPEVIIYHNPRCSKSRETLELLKKKKVGLKVIEYLNEPPTPETLKKILKMLKLSPREFIRKKEEEYKTLKLSDPGLSEDFLIFSMIKHPKLIERPIVICGNKAALGRPPENVLKIL